jgi:hypothetical protein
MRALGHRMVDDMFQYLSTVRERDTWRPVPQATKDFFRGKPAPTSGQSPESIYEEFREQILPHALGNIHPRFWGWVIGSGTPLGALADMLASAMNPNSGGFDQGYLRGVPGARLAEGDDGLPR